MEDIIFCGLNLGAWVTIVTVLSMFATLLLTKLREDIAFLGVIAILLLTGVLDTKEALSGFSSGSVCFLLCWLDWCIRACCNGLSATCWEHRRTIRQQWSD